MEASRSAGQDARRRSGGQESEVRREGGKEGRRK